MRSKIVPVISIIISVLLIGLIVSQYNKDYFYKFGGRRKSDFVFYFLGFKTEELPKDYLYPGELFYRWTWRMNPEGKITPEAHAALKDAGISLNFEYFPDRTYIEISVLNAYKSGDGRPTIDNRFNWLDGAISGVDYFYKPIELFDHIPKNEPFQIIERNTFKINGQSFPYAKARVISRNKLYTALVTYKITDSGKYFWTIYARTPGKEVNMQALDTILKMTKFKIQDHAT
jgi:hypothetical protein